MRLVSHPQLQFGQVNIAEIKLDPRSRDDIPALLKGLQYIYIHPPIREQVFTLLEQAVKGAVRKDTGRPGMELWRIFVLATVKLGLGCDFDRLQELANQHATLRAMLGHADGWDKTPYAMQTLVDNVSLLRPQVLAQINHVLVDAGHQLVKKKPGALFLKGRCDSFVVETDVHYPTDTNLLWDAIRSLITQAMRACDELNLPGWRQGAYHVRETKKALRNTQNIRPSTSANEDKRAAKRAQIQAAHRTYLNQARDMVEKGKCTVVQLMEKDALLLTGTRHLVEALTPWIRDAERQIEQIERRVLNGEAIPHDEKVFSLFERHTEWISKGKAGVPVELGVRVCVLEDQHQFILHHRVMWKETDDKVAVAMVSQAQERYPDLTQCSFDKGFHTPSNQAELKTMLEHVVLPKKGRRSQSDQAREGDDVFKQARRQHSAVESCINNLEQRGLDRCYSYGRDGFERHVALAVVACNLHRIGLILQRQEKARLQKTERRAA